MQTPAFAATKKARLIWVAAVIAACLFPTLAFGQTNSSWKGGTGNWSTSTDWTPNQGPNNGGGNTYNVTIDSGGADVVTLNQSATINSLVLGGVTGSASLQNLSGTAEDLNITGALSVNQTGTLTFGNGSILTVGGNSSSAGSLDLEGGSSLTASGNFTNFGGQFDVGMQSSSISSNATVTGTFTNTVGQIVLGGTGGQGVLTVGKLINTGGGDIEGGSKLVIENSGTLTNTTDAFNIGTQNSGGTLVIGGNISLSGNGRVVLSDGLGSIIEGASSSDVLTNVNNLMIGAGNIGNGSMGFVNGVQGKIETSGDMLSNVIDIDVSSAGFNNQGLILVNVRDQVSITGPTGSFLNFNSSTDTLTGGSYQVSGVLQFDGANINTNNANITLTGKGEIEDQNGNNALAGFSTNGSKGTFRLNPSANFTTSGNFTNDGTLFVSSGSKFAVGANGADNLTNFSGTTLTGGIYVVGGTLQFNGANIVTNEANITLNAAKAIIEDQNGHNALTNFAVNGSDGSFTLSGAQKFATSGAFSNAGNVTISNGTTFSVGGMKSYTQTKGTTTVNGALVVGSPGAINVSGGLLFGLGTITGNLNLSGGTLSPGTAAESIGELAISGGYKQSLSGVLDINLDGTSPAVQYDVLNISGAAVLGGALVVDALKKFTPSVGEQFDILDYGSKTGTFSSVECNFSNGDTCSITYNTTGAVLTIDAPLASTSHGAVSGSPAKRVSRGLMAGAAGGGVRGPVAMLSRAACFGARMLMASAAW